MTTALALLDIGDDAVCMATFTVGGVLTTPTLVTWSVWPPGASTPTLYIGGVAPEATTPGVGTARLQVPITGAGGWQVKVAGTGAAKGAMTGRFYVAPDPS